MMFETTEAEKKAMADASLADHDYFVIQNVTDVDKMRDEAWRRQQGQDLDGESKSSMIHHHRLSEECLWKKESPAHSSERTQKHEFWGRIELEK